MTNTTIGRALVVEDDHSWQQILSENLVDSGLDVDVAGNLEMALSLLRKQPHRIAVVDLSLQGKDPHNQDGLKVLAAARQLDPDCVTMLLTGFATVELAVSALTEYQAFTCLRKEAFQRSQFRQLVKQALASARQQAYHETGGEELPAISPIVGGIAVHEKPVHAALLVDDDAGWRAILAELLLDAGYQARVCSSFGEALGYLRREKFRLAVVDLSLSGKAAGGSSSREGEIGSHDLEGYRLLSSTRSAGIPTLVVSGMAKPDDIEKAYQEQGIFAFLEKQAFDRRAFLRIVQEAQDAGHTNRELDLLTSRERQVLTLLAQGMTNKEIAEVMVVSINTVKRHIKSVFSKLDIHTRSAAVAKFNNKTA